MLSVRPARSRFSSAHSATAALVQHNAQRSASFLLLLNGEDRRDWIEGHLVPIALVPLVRNILKRRYLLYEIADLLSVLPLHVTEAFAPIEASLDPDTCTRKALNSAINCAIKDLNERDQKTLLRSKPPLITPRVLAVMQDLKLDERAALAFCAKHNASALPYRKAYMARLDNWEPRFE
jgi:hypothetical protein